jgi:hypothetical protein
VQTPALPLAPPTQRAGGRQGGPTTVSQAAPSAAAAPQVPVWPDWMTPVEV